MSETEHEGSSGSSGPGSDAAGASERRLERACDGALDRGPGRSSGRSGPGPGPWLALALVVGLVRFWRLGLWSLWYDEGLTLADAFHSDLGYNALGYRLIRWTVEAFGGPPEEFTMRFLPAVVGWLAIPLTYWAFRGVCDGRRAALAALIVAVSSWELYWSQNARAYTLAQAAGLLGGGLVLRGLMGRSGKGRLLPTMAGALIVAGGVGFHLSSAVLLLAFTVAPLVLPLARVRLEPQGRRAARVLLATAALAVLAGSPWILGALREYLSKKQEFGLVSNVAHFAKSIGFFVTPLIAVAALLGAWSAFQRREDGGILCVVIAVLGLGAVASVGVFAQVTAQYAFVMMPWIAILAAWPLGAIEASTRRAGASLAFGALLVLPTLAETGLYLTVRMGERPRWREAYGYVWNQHAPGDVILGMQPGLADFYLDPGSTDLRRPRTVGWADRYSVQNYAAWARRGRGMWIVIRPDFFGKWTGGFAVERAAFQAFLREDCHLMKRFPVPMEGRDLDLEVYYKPGS